RMYYSAGSKIEQQGGRNLRVILDYELKKRVYRDLAKLGPQRESTGKKKEIAEKHGLQLVRGKIPLPDLRIEYETQEGEMARVDLELATGHYPGGPLAEKMVAVFSGYFTLGHFRVFTGTAYGKRPTSFGQKLLKQGHATVRDYMRRGSIFHLFSRTVYGQIEKDNLRNRKKHSFDFMRTRLVLLDFILANQELAYFETEQDKVSFFCEQLGV